MNPDIAVFERSDAWHRVTAGCGPVAAQAAFMQPPAASKRASRLRRNCIATEALLSQSSVEAAWLAAAALARHALRVQQQHDRGAPQALNPPDAYSHSTGS